MPSDTITHKLATIPDLPGVYLIRDAAGSVLYVGKARSLRKRLRQHFRAGAAIYGWLEQLYAHAEDLEIIVTASELEALILEASLIKEHRPRYNIRLTDDKSYPYLKLTDEAYPRLMVLRDLPRAARPAAGAAAGKRFHDPQRHELHGPGAGRVFGPYADASAMRRIMRLVPQLFGLRSCRRALDGSVVGKPCLNLHIGRCVGPCQGSEVVPAADYAEIVRSTARFLEGKAGQVIRELEARMRAAAAELNFEGAAKLRDKARAIRRVTEEQIVVATENREQDVIALAREGPRALIAVLEVRGGRLLAQHQFVFEHVADRAPAEIIDAFLTQHYSRATQIPGEVLVSSPPADADAWAELLSEARGGHVRLYTPQRGEKRRLADLAQRNAEVGLRALEANRAERQRATRAALDDLAAVLTLPAGPRRIECFDISTTQGRDSTGSQVVFTDGLPDKRSYRHYRMRGTEGKPDDYAMLAEMLRRRLGRGLAGDAKFVPLPDLIVVDGGKGQLGAALEVLAEVGLTTIPAVGLAKQQEEVFVPGLSDPLPMGEHQPAQFLLQRLRDEAHRFALTHHRGLRDSQVTKSMLDEVPQIGPARKRALLTAFGSVQAMAHASRDEWAAVPGRDRRAAEPLLRYLADGLPAREPPPDADTSSS